MHRADLRFRFADGRVASDAREWLRYWGERYPRDKYPPIDSLIVRGGSGLLSAQDFEWIGRWKDGALNNDKWKPNVAMVAYEVWVLASARLPGTQISDERTAAEFLAEWSSKIHDGVYKNGLVQKRFGLSRASTLLHVISGGSFPILDGRVRRAVKRLTGSPAPKDDVAWYIDSYRPLFQQIVDACQETDIRKVDEALFSYGGKNLKILDM